MSDLENAIQIALETHQHQTDKAGEPYILHPLGLMLKFDDEDFRIAAVLHDVVEDSGFDLDYLKKKGFSPVVFSARMTWSDQKVSRCPDVFVGFGWMPAG